MSDIFFFHFKGEIMATTLAIVIICTLFVSLLTSAFFILEFFLDKLYEISSEKDFFIDLSKDRENELEGDDRAK